MTLDATRWVDLSESKVNRGMRVFCLACGGTLPYEEAFADMEGPAYRAYYHRACTSQADRLNAGARP